MFGDVKSDDIFNLPTKVTKSNKIKDFQYNVLHRYLPTNNVLFRYKLSHTNTCTLSYRDRNNLLFHRIHVQKSLVGI